MLGDLNDESVITSGGGEISMLEPGTMESKEPGTLASLEPVVSSTRNLESQLNVLSGENSKHSPVIKHNLLYRTYQGSRIAFWNPQN